jgi:Transglutaminase-like superfamily
MFYSCVARIRQFGSLTARDRLLLLKALGWLALAALAVAALPFRSLERLAARPVRGREPPQPARTATVNRVRWAILACARRVPWRAQCFEQGLAAQFMLRRRGIPSVLYYGAAPDGGDGLCAHVWVRDGHTDVVGCEVAARFAVLTTYPNGRPLINPPVPCI